MLSARGRVFGPRLAGLVGALLLLLPIGCASPVAKRLRTAADTGDVPPGLRVVWNDYDPKWGGKRVTVEGDGSVRVERWRPGAPQTDPETWAGHASEEQLAELVDLLVEIEAWEQRVETETTPLDEARARLTVHVQDGRERVWEWANDLEANGRLVLVENQLEALVREARRSGARGDGSDAVPDGG